MRAFFFLAVALLGAACSDDENGQGAGGDGEGGAGGGASCDANDRPSEQTVTFVIRNETATDKLLVVKAKECADLDIGLAADRDSGRLQLDDYDNTCICECAGPPEPGQHTLRPIAAGEEVSLVWDGRSYASCPYTEDCGDGYSEEGHNGYLVPAAPGDYAATLLFLDAIPEGWSCDPFNGDLECSFSDGECPFELTSIDAPFTLGSESVTVPVTLE